jgi:hypothetical protein
MRIYTSTFQYNVDLQVDTNLSEKSICLCLQDRTWRQYGPSKRRYLITRPHGFTTQETKIDILPPLETRYSVPDFRVSFTSLFPFKHIMILLRFLYLCCILWYKNFY